jgi:hypothetical protein
MLFLRNETANMAWAIVQQVAEPLTPSRTR